MEDKIKSFKALNKIRNISSILHREIVEAYFLSSQLSYEYKGHLFTWKNMDNTDGLIDFLYFRGKNHHDKCIKFNVAENMPCFSWACKVYLKTFLSDLFPFVTSDHLDEYNELHLEIEYMLDKQKDGRILDCDKDRYEELVKFLYGVEYEDKNDA